MTFRSSVPDKRASKENTLIPFRAKKTAHRRVLFTFPPAYSALSEAHLFNAGDLEGAAPFYLFFGSLFQPSLRRPRRETARMFDIE